jgi:hypothetical protein
LLAWRDDITTIATKAAPQDVGTSNDRRLINVARGERWMAKGPRTRWREIVRFREDLRHGEFPLAESAAGLDDVAIGRAPPEPAESFADRPPPKRTESVVRHPEAGKGS